ncbi:virulence associated lipoprotein (plasmid) [Borrelia puertoricensis]|uniref:virulence associated lipoprotein n=1 Tax=Borrelia puertoricensis TaxID=2756107 RepID=UPI003EBC569F
MKHKFFIIFLSILILFFACNQNKTGRTNPPKPMTEEEAQKQQIVDDIKNLLQTITPILRVHNDNTWDEDAQGYNLSGQGQIFSAIDHHITLPTGRVVSKGYVFDESKAARREVYLAFEYNKDYLNAFATIANKLVKYARGDYPTNEHVRKLVLSIREYAKAYYLQAFDTINNKKDELEKLSLENLNTLHNKINAIQEAKTNIVNIAHKIKEDYDAKIKVGSGTLQSEVQTYAHSLAIYDYIASKIKEGEFEKNLNTIKQEANEIINILTLP